MKFLVIGLGSMGKRRIRNLQYLKAGEIIGVEPNEERRKQVEAEYKIKAVSSADAGFNEKPDAVIISTPPDMHGKYALVAAERGIPFFAEASVVIEDDIVKANSVAKMNNTAAMPSCTMRFNWRTKKVKELVDNGAIGKVVAIQYHMGQWLPDWHPWEDIRKFYVGKRETSAGREMVPFELEWIQWVFGHVHKVSCSKGKFTNLPVDIDDVYSMNLELGDGIIANLLIDVVSRYPVRRMEIMGDKGSIILDWYNDAVRIFDPEAKEWTDFKEEEKATKEGYVIKDDMYIEEMRHFVNVVNGKEQLNYTMDDDITNLKILLDAEKSSDTGRTITRM